MVFFTAQSIIRTIVMLLLLSYAKEPAVNLTLIQAGERVQSDPRA